MSCQVKSFKIDLDVDIQPGNYSVKVCIQVEIKLLQVHPKHCRDNYEFIECFMLLFFI